MSTGPELIRPEAKEERNWLPMAISAAIVLVIGALIVFVLARGNSSLGVSAPNAPLDPYAASLPITNVVMSESSNLAGTKVTYVDGHIANTGARTVTAITVQALYRNAAHEVAQNETQSLRIIRTRDPYVDLEPVSAAPLKPGDQRDFRLIFDAVNADWDGVYPEIRILKVQAQ